MNMNTVGIPYNDKDITAAQTNINEAWLIVTILLLVKDFVFTLK